MLYFSKQLDIQVYGKQTKFCMQETLLVFFSVILRMEGHTLP
jgi:hypothetical protein